MKFKLFVLGILWCSVSFGQTKQTGFDALGKGDVDALIALFDNPVELCLEDKLEILDKTSARKAMKIFFDKNPPKSLKPIHNGVSKGQDSRYYIGLYSTSNNNLFRVFIYADETGGKKLIKELRILKEN
ncbi:MAG: DUF4783 domain-containing protein [Bacteroidota bacterium]|nr:DUF4783 domain-containing protein [Bacteroidota bacterium]